jgi:anti-sigma regulatory factor (Ser/Thr protein kinase)
MMTPLILGTRMIPAAPENVSPARHWLSGLLAAEYAEIADDVVLLACELVTNAIRHSDSAEPDADGRPGSVALTVLDVGDAVRVEVIDAGSGSSVPRVVEEDPDALNGRGLSMVHVLCEGRWGHYTDRDGRTAWFEIAGERPGGPGAP